MLSPAELEEIGRVMTEQAGPSAGQQNNTLKYAGYAIAGYLGVCALVAMGTDKNSVRQNLLAKCGSNSAFCTCQADATVSQMSFIKGPLQLLGVLELRPVAQQCGHLR